MKTLKFTKTKSRIKREGLLLSRSAKRTLYSVYAISYVSIMTLFAGTNNELTAIKTVNEKLQAQSVTFTENKGQVRDQLNHSRPDVLFSGSNNGMVYHLRKDGISYQLYRRRSDVNQVYRLDISWLGINNQSKVETDEALPGYDNFYNTESGVPALNVKTYKGATYKNIYKNVDLHYYEKDGNLEYDFIVAPKTDYRQIKLQVKGAEKISLLKNGSVLYKTPFGDILEEAPVVFQNGKKIKARWILKDNTLSFEIENYNPLLPVLIDPVTRVWGTYYGGTGGQFQAALSNSCRTDASGNVYMAGNTDASNSIATTGSHQANIGGTFDTYLIKFNSAGVRQWGTYYGGSGDDQGGYCDVDASGNVYLFADTWSTSGIATASTHQTTHGGGSNDCYLVKFNSSGVRQWATYYGGSGNDNSSAIRLDATGNILIGGNTRSSNAISSIGSHQASYGGTGDWDSFIAKFNSNGVRQWATYYGGGSDDIVGECSSDATGNIYVSGITASTVNIATLGSHQPTYGGGVADGYLVKFNANGVRQWGTYYGGSLTDHGNGCSAMANGDVFLSGAAGSTAGISTIGSHQSTYGGGTWDGFLVKFNAAGTRLWGTYYGDTGNDRAETCFSDAAGNVLIAGNTTSSAGIATTGNHQITFAGGTSSDAFLSKFNGTGNIQWGTYYGGSGSDFGTQCFVDNATGRIYLTGSTSTSGGTTIATPGSHQANYIGNNDGFLAQFIDCNAPNPPVNTTAAGNLTLCSNGSTTLNVSATGFVNWFSSPSSTLVLGTGAVFNTSLLSSGTHTYYASASNTCSPSSRTPITVTVNPLITVNSGAVCAGSSFTMVPGGVVSFTFSNGSAVVSPVTNTSYTVTGTDQLGCTGSAVSNVTVNQLPIVTVNSGSMCSGSQYTIVPAGANNYTISGITPYVSPPVTSAYTVTGESANGCIGTAICNITVNPSPTVTAVSSKTTICKGNTSILTASGASTYSWSNGSTSPSISISPTVTTSYTVTGTAANSCSKKTVFTQTVNQCIGLTESIANSEIVIFPNPNAGNFSIKTSFVSENGVVEIYNSIGQLVLSEKINTKNNKIDLSENSKGVYFIRVLDHNTVIATSKVIKE